MSFYKNVCVVVGILVDLIAIQKCFFSFCFSFVKHADPFCVLYYRKLIFVQLQQNIYKNEKKNIKNMSQFEVIFALRFVREIKKKPIVKPMTISRDDKNSPVPLKWNPCRQ